MGVETIAFSPGNIFEVLTPAIGVLVFLFGAAVWLLCWNWGRRDRR